MMRFFLLATTIAFVLGTAVFVRDVSRSSAPNVPPITQKRIIIFETEIPPELPQDSNTSRDVAVPTALLDDALPSVREDAVESLADLGNSEAITGLRYALSDQNDTVRRLAIESLASIGSDEAIAALVLVLDDPDVDLRELAVDELADIGTATALMVLQAFLADADPRVREMAMDVLGKWDQSISTLRLKMSICETSGASKSSPSNYRFVLSNMRCSVADQGKHIESDWIGELVISSLQA